MIIISYLRQKEKRKGGGREGTDHNSVPVRLVAMEISKEGGGGGGEEGNRRGQITMYVKIHTILLLDPPHAIPSVRHHLCSTRPAPPKHQKEKWKWIWSAPTCQPYEITHTTTERLTHGETTMMRFVGRGSLWWSGVHIFLSAIFQPIVWRKTGSSLIENSLITLIYYWQIC